jgi:simple sugar transport system ATP-binding protein
MVRLRSEPSGAAARPERRARGLLCAPEERMGHAAAPDMSLTENAFLTGKVRERLTRRGFVRWGAARGFAERIIQGFDVRTPGPGSRRGRCRGATSRSS